MQVAGTGRRWVEAINSLAERRSWPRRYPCTPAHGPTCHHGIPRRRPLARRKGRPLLLEPVVGRADHPVGRRRATCRSRRSTGEQRWFWLYHAPPTGTLLCRDGRREFPTTRLASWIAGTGPDVVLAGHIHQAPWVDGGSWHDRLGDTLVFNPDARSEDSAAPDRRHRRRERRLVRRVQGRSRYGWPNASRRPGRAPSRYGSARPGDGRACRGCRRSSRCGPHDQRTAASRR